MGTAFLESLGDFLKPTIISKEIEHNGKKATFYFRELNGEEGTNIFSGFSSSNPDAKDQAVRALRNRCVAAGVCDEEGKAVWNEKEAAKLPMPLLNKLHEVVMDHNGLNVKAEKEELKNE